MCHVHAYGPLTAWGFGAGISLGLLVSAGSAGAAILTPPGLNAGDPFRLAFVSSAAHGIVSNDIADFDQFIQSLADAAGLGDYDGNPVAWQAIGSTATVNANDPDRLPASETAPIYLVSGVALVDGGAADLWDGSIDVFFNVTETGAVLGSEQVSTGTEPDGGGAADHLGLSDHNVGITDQTNSEWVVLSQNGVLNKRLYGVSEVLTVPLSIPEPASAAVFTLAAGLMLRRRAGAGK